MKFSIAFNTLSYSKNLIEAGVPPQQAEVHAQTLSEIFAGRLVTRQDLKEPELRLIIKT